MKALFSIVALGLTTTPALAGPDVPHRPMGQIAILSMPIAAARDCMAAELDKTGGVRVTPAGDGYDVDWSPPGGLFTKATDEFYITYRLRVAEGGTSVTGLYRRPLSAKAAVNSIKDMGKRCLVVTEMRPEEVATASHP